jgi:hypothetical protein
MSISESITQSDVRATRVMARYGVRVLDLVARTID